MMALSGSDKRLALPRCSSCSPSCVALTRAAASARLGMGGSRCGGGGGGGSGAAVPSTGGAHGSSAGGTASPASTSSTCRHLLHLRWHWYADPQMALPDDEPALVVTETQRSQIKRHAGTPAPGAPLRALDAWVNRPHLHALGHTQAYSNPALDASRPRVVACRSGAWFQAAGHVVLPRLQAPTLSRSAMCSRWWVSCRAYASSTGSSGRTRQSASWCALFTCDDIAAGRSQTRHNCRRSLWARCRDASVTGWARCMLFTDAPADASRRPTVPWHCSSSSDIQSRGVC